MIKLTFLGDMMCKSQMLQSYQTKSGYDFSSIFDKMTGYFQKSDYILANLETPISLNNQDLTAEKWCFYSPFEFAEAVQKSGVNFVATANNHCLDRGIDGIHSTIKSLDKLGFLHTGVSDAPNPPWAIFEENGIRFGVLSYTYGTNAFSNHYYLNKKEYFHVNLFQNQELSNPLTRHCYFHKKRFYAKIYNKLNNYTQPKWSRGKVYERKEFSASCLKKCFEKITALKSQGVDFIILYMHAGGQYNSQPTEYTKELSESLIQHGVNIVVGTHEHVVHGGDFSRMSNNQLLTYSLGNFNGIAGVYDKPFDKMAEYSIAWNVYIDEKNISLAKTTFSVLKTIEIESKKIQTVPVYDLIMNTNNSEHRKKLEEDLLKIASIFSDKHYTKVESEYTISQVED